MKGVKLVSVVGMLILNCVGLAVGAGSSVDDHLVPVEKADNAQSPESTYRKLWQQKLLVTPGEIAKSVHLPGNVGVETAVSVYREESAKKPSYRVTATQASRSLWDCVAPDAKERVNPDSIKIVRADAPLPESTAIILGKVWLAMLLQMRQERKADEISLDSSKEIFSAVAHGKVIEGQLRGFGKRNTSALSDLATSLLQYCDAPEPQRAEMARNIEKAASALLKRVETK